MEINFCEYLMNIGLINKESFSNIILDYHRTYSNNNNNFLANMIFILKNFIENLTQQEKNYMCLNLVQYYLRIINNKKISKLKTLYALYKRKLSIIKLKYLYKWKLIIILNIHNDKNEDFINLKKKDIKQKKEIKRKYRNEQNKLDNYHFLSEDNNNINKDIFNILFNKKKKCPKNESYNKKYDSTKDISIKKNPKYFEELQTSLAIKEQKELEECTFRPKINYTSRIKNKEVKEISPIKKNNKKHISEIFNKLHDDNIFYKNKINTSREKYELKLKKEIPFKPKIYSNSLTKKYPKINKSFTERQKMFLEKKEKHSENIKKTMDINFSKLCPFVPEVNIKLNKKNVKKDKIIKYVDNSSILKEFYFNNKNKYNKSNKYISPFLRLYEDSKKRNIRKNKREKDYDNYLNDMANSHCKKNNDIDYDKINELSSYQKKKEIMQKTIKKVEEEEGSTFRPNIYINELSKNINSDFYERNEKFLKDKQNFIDTSIKEKEKLFKKKNILKKKKKK